MAFQCPVPWVTLTLPDAKSPVCYRLTDRGGIAVAIGIPGTRTGATPSEGLYTEQGEMAEPASLSFEEFESVNRARRQGRMPEVRPPFELPPKASIASGPAFRFATVAIPREAIATYRDFLAKRQYRVPPLTAKEANAAAAYVLWATRYTPGAGLETAGPQSYPPRFLRYGGFIPVTYPLIYVFMLLVDPPHLYHTPSAFYDALRYYGWQTQDNIPGSNWSTWVPPSAHSPGLPPSVQRALPF